MNYTINETFELSGYTAHIQTDEYLANKIDHKFKMTVRDILTNEVEEYYQWDLLTLGVTDTTGDPSTWPAKSAIANGGIYLNFNNDYIDFKQLLPCSLIEEPNTALGYNSSEINIYFDMNKAPDITFYSKVLPFFQRSMPYTNASEDPIIESARPDYDFDYRSQQTIQDLANVKTNFDYNTVGDMYVNNDAGRMKIYEQGKEVFPSDQSKVTPTYYTDVSAVYITSAQAGAIEPDYSSVKSTIWNDITDDEAEIPCTPVEQGVIDYIKFGDCQSLVKYDVFRQTISDQNFPGDYKKNVVKFSVDFFNYGINKVDIDRIQVVITRGTIDDKNCLHVKLTNINNTLGHPLNQKQIYKRIKYLNKPVTDINDPNFIDVTNNSDVILNIDDQSTTGNTLEFDILPYDIDCGYTVVVYGWLNENIAGYTTQQVIDKSTGYAGPLQYDIAVAPVFEPIEITVECKRSQTRFSGGYSQCEAYWQNAVSCKDLNNRNVLNEFKSGEDYLEEYGIIKFTVHNPNYNNPDWINEDYFCVVRDDITPPVNIEYVIMEDLPATFDENGDYIFYAVNINHHNKDPYQSASVSFNVQVKTRSEKQSDCYSYWSDIDGGATFWYMSTTHDFPMDGELYTCNELPQSIKTETGIVTDCYKTQQGRFTPIGTFIKANDHKLDLYYDSAKVLDENKSQFGLMRYVFVDESVKSLRQEARIEISLFSNGTNVAKLYIENGEIRQVVSDITPFHILIDTIENHYLDDSQSYGYIVFEVVDIIPQTISAKVQCYDYPEKDAIPARVTWGSNSFIPDEWEFFKDFTIFTKSELELEGAYVGVKSLYCMALKTTNNAYIDTSYVDPVNGRASILIDGDDTNFLVDGQYKIHSTNNLNRFPSNSFWSIIPASQLNEGKGDAAYEIDGDVVYPWVGGGHRLFYSRNAMANFKIVSNNSNYDFSKVQFDNDNIVYGNIDPYTGTVPATQVIPVIQKTIPDVPRFSNLQWGTNNLNLSSDTTLDANNGIALYGELHAGNNVTLTLKPGEYHFTKFDVGTNFNLYIDANGSAGEYVRICIRDKAVIGNSFKVNNVNDDFMSFMIYSAYSSTNKSDYAIEIAAGDRNYNYGVIVAPDGAVRFNNGQTAWQGAIWAKWLSLQNGVAFLGKGGYA